MKAAFHMTAGPQASVLALWARYRAMVPAAPALPPPAEYFCDNRAEADACLALVLSGRKRATSSALVEYQRAGEPLPRPGKLLIVTDWAGEAGALIRTHSVTIRRFGDVPASFARMEGEGDLSLAGWRAMHHAFWTRNSSADEIVDDDFQIVCEEFDLVLAA